jgi:hypothetical protein
VYLAADLLAVLLHTHFIWLLPMPLFVIVFGGWRIVSEWCTVGTTFWQCGQPVSTEMLYTVAAEPAGY